jgi:hypothetical protein
VVQAVCHCADCQRQTGRPFSVFFGVPQAAFRCGGDTLASFSTTGEDHGGETQRKFCSACGSPVFSISPVAAELIFIKAGSLDDASWVQPTVEAWTFRRSLGRRGSIMSRTSSAVRANAYSPSPPG